MTDPRSAFAHHFLFQLTFEGSARDWLEDHPDPQIWFQTAADLSLDLPGNAELLVWILRHPLCPEAIAADTFCRLEGWRYCGVTADSCDPEDPAVPVLLALVARAAGRGWHSFGLNDGGGHHRHEMLAACMAARQALTRRGGLPLIDPPVMLLAKVPRGPRPEPQKTWIFEGRELLTWRQDPRPH
ncbi:MAG TPA: hypothetical protein DD444_03980 [Citreicella sp.]|jgi:hypothetical protein|uniref:DUF4274 domain-containing protein n=1 Tax=Salipiger marinus TaxID=555512 RepID=A0A1G8PMY3_9RHOB|nr:hypothetical protein [Salipiger marinus]SDI93901.1 hypothetical protein SAMN04487993_101317 [Salipiger marinus]HBM58330.1 hypothetical protein [Citreicella sp.]HBT00166.1 hypothetical protein [Citreicella sp.]